MNADELRARAAEIPWYHSIDLGDGVVTQGVSQATPLSEQQLPDFAGRTVLDIGAWDGYYSFLAERNGAKRVVALDHYAWGVDIAARDKYWQECKQSDRVPDRTRDTTDFYRPDLPYRRGFDFAREVLGSNVEPFVGDFMALDLASLGAFDVVLLLGVLYHITEPMACLDRLRAITREVAVVETVALHIPAFTRHGLLEFFPGDGLNGDFGNWYVPTLPALQGLLLAAGFSRVEVVQGPPSTRSPNRVVRWAQRLARGHPPNSYYRALVHAYV